MSCGANCSHGGVCTRPVDHDGDHETGGSDGRIFCSWPQGDWDVYEDPMETLIRSLAIIVGESSSGEYANTAIPAELVTNALTDDPRDVE